MKELITRSFENTDVIFREVNGMAEVRIDEVAKFCGWSFTKDNKKEQIRWERVNEKIVELGGAKVGTGDFITEKMMYRLIGKANNSRADKFMDWVSDVLVDIRKHGMYATNELLDNPDLLIEVATKLKEERAARLRAEEEKKRLIHQGKLYTTSEIAKELNYRSATKFNKELEEKKIQYKLNGTWVLCARYSECGYVSIKQTELDNGKIIYDRKWTGTGRDFILNLF